MAERFPNVIDPYINVDGEQSHSFSLKGCRFNYQFSGYASSTSTFTLDAIPGTGYRFDHWEFAPEHPFDSISSAHLSATKTGTPQDPLDPYRIVAICYFKSDSPPPEEDSAINLTLVDVPRNVSTLIGGGLRTGPVGTTTTYSVIAELLQSMKGRYRFIYWLDDQNVKHREKSFDKTFTFKAGYTASNPEQITFYAYFTPCTGLILRSSSSGLILRGKANRILRDE